jgi:phage terminase large subunit
MRDTDYDEYEHIYLGRPKEIADGAIYKAEFEQIKRENRICKIPYDPNLPVYTSWDLGILDPTAIWFYQIYGKEVRVIDHYEANNEPLAHYARILDEKAQQFGYRYEKHFAPHDIAARDLSSGVSREQTMANLGYRMSKGARLGVEDRIEASRQFLKNCWFDAENCKHGIRALQNYRREFNDKLDQFKATPVHDWASHSSDAFGEGALNINRMQAPKAPPKPLTKSASSWQG